MKKPIPLTGFLVVGAVVGAIASPATGQQAKQISERMREAEAPSVRVAAAPETVHRTQTDGPIPLPDMTAQRPVRAMRRGAVDTGPISRPPLDSIPGPAEVAASRTPDPAKDMQRVDPDARAVVARRKEAVVVRGRAQSGSLQADKMPALDHFPFQAQDLAWNQRVFRGKTTHNPDDEPPYSNWQRYAYDVGVSQMREDGTWVDHEPYAEGAPWTNDGFYIYDVPVYAISSGRVVNCWRNAPENPRAWTPGMDPGGDVQLADQTWLHEDTRAGKVHGSGNFLFIEEENGNVVHYAHARPGTIPKSLCPHEGVLLAPASGGPPAASAVPESQQATVEAGEFLFRAGNSGTSSAPHLHIGRNESDKATSLPMRFRHGLAHGLTSWYGTADTGGWNSFAGSGIPSGPVLVWPPRRPGGHWSWSGQTPSVWGAYVQHMADSGYMPAWLDGYSVDGNPYLNTIWVPATDAWRIYALMDADGYQETFNEVTGEGYALVHVDSVLQGGNVKYNAIFRKGASNDYIARHGQGAQAFENHFDSVTGNGYSPVTVSVVSIDGNRYYTSLFRKQNLGGWVLLPEIDNADYQSVYNENAAVGRYPRYVNAYRHNGRTNYSVVFSTVPGGGNRLDRHGMTPSVYQQTFNGAAPKLLEAVSGTDGASQHRFIAYWHR